jgi:hypothetical protein
VSIKNIVLVLSLALFIIVVGYIIFIQKTDTISSPTPTSTSSENANWGTYRSEDWGFELRYPNDWVVKEKTFGGYYSKFNVVLRPTTGRITQFPVLINIVLPEFIDGSFKNIEKTTSEVIVDRVLGIKYEYEFEGGQETAIILPLGEYKLILGTDDEQYADIFNQVLETFKFLK